MSGSTIKFYKLNSILGTDILGLTYKADRIFYDKNTGNPTVKNYKIKIISLDKLAKLNIDFNVLQDQITLLEKISLTIKAHNHMALYYEHFIDTDSNGIKNMYIVSDYIVGTNLRDYMLIKKEIEFQSLIEIYSNIAQDIKFIHNSVPGIAHQNIKPSNIILDVSDNKLKLIDFSLSCSKKCSIRGPGTVYYTSPEILRLVITPGLQTIPLETAFNHDIWSMGVIFYQLANIGKNYINFSSNNPEIMAKDILLLPINKSTYHNEQINKLVNGILIKTNEKRFTLDQVISMINNIKPKCIIPGNSGIDNKKARELAFKYGYNTENLTDLMVCKLLYEKMKKCVVSRSGTQYIKDDLIIFMNILGISVNKSLNIDELCILINKELKENYILYSKRITETLINALNIIVTGSNTPDIKEKYDNMLKLALDNNLLNFDMLRNLRDELNDKYIAIKNTGQEGKIFAIQHNIVLDLLKLDKNNKSTKL